MRQRRTTLTADQAAENNAMVRASGLVKKFGDFSAVDGITFDVHHGETFGMLGPNGAGKTSTLRMMSGLSPVTSGESEIDGIDATSNPRSIRDVIGVYPSKTGWTRTLAFATTSPCMASTLG